MRVLKIEANDDFAAIERRLLRPGVAAGTVGLERLQALNPHVDFRALRPGTLLFVPEAPGVADDAGDSVGTDAFEGVIEEVRGGWKAAAARVRSGTARVSADAEALGAALKTAAVRRAIEADAELKEGLQSALAALKTSRARADVAQRDIEAAAEATADELKALARLFR